MDAVQTVTAPHASVIMPLLNIGHSHDGGTVGSTRNSEPNKSSPSPLPAKERSPEKPATKPLRKKQDLSQTAGEGG